MLSSSGEQVNRVAMQRLSSVAFTAVKVMELPICEKCGTYFTRLPCPVCSAGDQISPSMDSGDLLVQAFMKQDSGDVIKPENTRRIMFFGRVGTPGEPFKLELVLRTRAEIDLILDESSLFSPRRFGRDPERDLEYIQTVEMVIKHLHSQLEAKALTLGDAQEEIRVLREENEALRDEIGRVAAPHQSVALVEVKGVGPKTVSTLKSAGIESTSDLLQVDDLDSLAEKTGITRSKLEQIKKNIGQPR